MEEQNNTERQEQEQWHHVVSLEDLGGLKRKVSVTYDNIAVKMAFDKASEAVGKRVTINGFRRGKAPRALVERFCTKEIEASAASMLAQEGYLHAVYEHKLAALSEPKVDDPKFNVDGTFSCEILVDVRPSITPSGYIGLKLTKPDIDPAQISSSMLGELRQKFAKFEEAPVVVSGATVVVDYTLSVDGQEITSHQGVPLTVNENGKVPLGSAQLNGLEVDAKVVSKLMLPDDFQNHGGKEADVNIHIRRILTSVPPTDEELALRNGLTSAEDLLKNVQQQANMEAGRQIRHALEEQTVDVLLSLHSFEVPEDWVDRELQYLVKQLGITKDLDEETGKVVRGLSERNVKRSFMLDAIYDAEPNLRVKNEEVEQLIDQEAVKQSVPKTQMKRMLLKQGMMDSVVELVKSKKIMDFLISNAEIVTKAAVMAPQEAEVTSQAGE